MTTNKKLTLCTLLVVFAFLPLILNTVRWANACLNGYDLGIYHVNMIEIVHQGTVNPFNVVRGAKTLNDHFIPASIPAAWFISIFGHQAWSSIFFEWLCWSAALGGLMWITHHAYKNATLTLVMGLMLVFSRGTLVGVYFPVHADFWSLPFWVLFAASVYRHNHPAILGSAFLIFFFKESYAIAFLPLSFWFLYRKPRWLGVSLLALCLSFIAFAFVLRPIIFGPAHPFATLMFKGILADPFGHLINLAKTFPYKEFFESYLSIFMLLYLAFRKRPQSTFVLILPLVPLLGLHFLAGYLGFHYAGLFTVSALTAVTASGALKEAWSHPRWRWALIIVSMSPGFFYSLRQTEFLYKFDDRCQISATKRAEIAHAESFLKEAAPSANIGVTGGLVANLLAPGRRVHHLLSHSEIQREYDYLVLEKGSVGDPYPLTRAKVQKVLETCRPLAKQILFEGEHLAVLRGPIPCGCAYQWPSPASDLGISPPCPPL